MFNVHVIFFRVGLLTIIILFLFSYGLNRTPLRTLVEGYHKTRSQILSKTNVWGFGISKPHKKDRNYFFGMTYPVENQTFIYLFALVYFMDALTDYKTL